mmetsp:Transcript_9649/g.14779  ORF Transcript_9649/g.14779 Transcript_9649/m.14779 type:complete len:233 (-) Transcript_9649:350-1048(-)
MQGSFLWKQDGRQQHTFLRPSWVKRKFAFKEDEMTYINRHGIRRIVSIKNAKIKTKSDAPTPYTLELEPDFYIAIATAEEFRLWTEILLPPRPSLFLSKSIKAEEEEINLVIPTPSPPETQVPVKRRGIKQNSLFSAPQPAKSIKIKSTSYLIFVSAWILNSWFLAMIAFLLLSWTNKEVEIRAMIEKEDEMNDDASTMNVVTPTTITNYQEIQREQVDLIRHKTPDGFVLE